jgi:hypothetical protein
VHWHSLVIVAAVAAGVSCRRVGPLDSDLTSCVPPDAVALAGLDLHRLRAAPFYHELALPALDAFRGASYLLAASNGSQLLLAARGNFSEPPPGAKLLNSHLAVAGSSDMVRAATAQHRTGRTGAAPLTDRGAILAGTAQMWAVAPGGISLPLPGNAANLNRLFRFADYFTLAGKADRRLDLELAAHCRDEAAASRFEESLRAALSLAGAGYARQPEIAAAVDSAVITRDHSVVRATFTAGADSLRKLLRF